MEDFTHTAEDELWEILETIKYLKEKAEAQIKEINEIIKEMS